MGKTVQTKKNLSVEGLRGIAILFIAVYHLLYKFTTDYAQNWSGLKIVKKFPLVSHWGAIGVGIFFIISAYFLYSEKETADFSYFDFLKKKLLRLYPLYAVCITITYVVSLFLRYPDYTKTFRDYLLNLFLINGYIGTPYIDGAHWYLTALISFILVTGLLKKCRKDKNPVFYAVWIATAGIAKGVAVLLVKLKLNFLHCDLVFSGIYKILGGGFIGICCIGIILHMFMAGHLENTYKKITALVVVAMSIGYTIGATNLWRVWSTVIAVVIVVLCLKNKLNFMGNRVFVAMGAISYPFYLCHQEIGYFIGYKLKAVFSAYHIWYLLLALIVAFVIAFLLNFAEQKITQRKKHSVKKG